MKASPWTKAVDARKARNRLLAKRGEKKAQSAEVINSDIQVLRSLERTISDRQTEAFKLRERDSVAVQLCEKRAARFSKSEAALPITQYELATISAEKRLSAYEGLIALCAELDQLDDAIEALWL